MKMKILIACVVLLLIPCFPQTPADDTVASVKSAVGKVEVIIENDIGVETSRLALTAGMPLKGGEKIATGPGASATVLFEDGTAVEVSEKSLFSVHDHTIGADRNRNTVTLFIGFLVAKVKKLAQGEDSNFEIVTPSDVAAVRGTVFHVAVAEDGSSDVGVHRGSVEMKDGINDDTPSAVINEKEAMETAFTGEKTKRANFAAASYDYRKWNEARRRTFRQSPERTIASVEHKTKTAIELLTKKQDAMRAVLLKFREASERNEAARKANNAEEMRRARWAEISLAMDLFRLKQREKSIMGTYWSSRHVAKQLDALADEMPALRPKLVGPLETLKTLDRRMWLQKKDMDKVFFDHREFLAARLKAIDMTPEKVRERMEELRKAREENAAEHRTESGDKQLPKTERK